ncbi:NGG1 interacting factor 3 [Glugoides intestinalis]
MIQNIAKAVEQFAPATIAEKWDNTGILIDSGTPKTANKTVLLAIDFTPDVLEECIQKNIKYVVSYHPVIFKSLKSLNSGLLTKCVQNFISVYCPHTQLDSLMNREFSEMVGKNPGTLQDIVKILKKITNLEWLRVVKSNAKERVYENNDIDILYGVGSAFKGFQGKDCLIVTGEMSHHDLLWCKYNGVDVIMLEHSNSERIFLKTIKTLMLKHLDGFEILISQADRDPVEII